jgi:nucleotide-binding universal stress UspA family protein
MIRACRLAGRSGASLRIVRVLPSFPDGDERIAMRERIAEEARKYHDSPLYPELDLSIRLKTGDPAEAILKEAEDFDPDLIVLGAESELRLRDVFLGSTATEVVRRARHPVLVAQTDGDRDWSNVMAAIDEDCADAVLRLAVDYGKPDRLLVVHAHGSAPQALFGYGELLEDVRSDQVEKVELLLSGIEGAARIEVRHLVEEGDPTSVIYKAWTDGEPDLLVIGTHGRTGLAWLAEGSVADTVLLGCPADILVAPAARSRP